MIRVTCIDKGVSYDSLILAAYDNAGSRTKKLSRKKRFFLRLSLGPHIVQYPSLSY